MKTKFLTFSLLLIGMSAGAQTLVSVSVSDDCSRNGQRYYYDKNGYGYADLGLGVMWATMNVGATAPEDYGNYFAWGETAEKSDYSWSTYTHCQGSFTTLTKYCYQKVYGIVDNKMTLDPEDDAAHVNWGGAWRMPTYAEWIELREQCIWTWTEQNGKIGYLVTAKNGNSIFLPAAGFRQDSYLSTEGEFGGYWSSSLHGGVSQSANGEFFTAGNEIYAKDRIYGYSVRSVSESTSDATDHTLMLYADGCDEHNIFYCLAEQQLSVSANPMEHRHFVQWNDGNTDNPRLVAMNQNLTYTAIFANDHEGKCGDNLSWKYTNSTLTITGTGAMYDYTSSTMPWILLRDSITEIVISSGCTLIGNSVFAGCTNLNSVTIPNSVTGIGDSAFSGCGKLCKIYCYAVEPPVAELSSFENYNAYLYVPCDCIRDYQKDAVFGGFKYIDCGETGVEELSNVPADKHGKLFHNGQLYILRDDVLYDAHGARIE